MRNMRIGFLLLAASSAVLAGCFAIKAAQTASPDIPPATPLVEAPTPELAALADEKCGDGVCDALEAEQGLCPEDCRDEGSIEYEQLREFEYYVTNPSSGSKIYLRVYPSPSSLAEIPTLILIPGGNGDGSMYIDQSPGGSAVEQLSGAGYNVVVFDPEGRGRSEGREDFNGFIGQDSLYAVTRLVETLPHTGTIGYLAQSYGISLAAGVLARYPDGPAAFLIDWEGPANREDITVGCPSANTDISQQSAPGDHSCTDDLYWSEREAELFAAGIRVPYLRVQSLRDHVQPDLSHAEDMIRAATATSYGGNGQSPWTRLNDLEPNQVYAPLQEALLRENDREKSALFIQYARELFDRVQESGTGGDPARETPGDGVVYLGLMVHLEGWFEEAQNRTQFEKHLSAALDLAEIFEEHGARVTFEASPETIQACGIWENLLLELQNRGHGIGVHADRGYTADPNYDLEAFTAEIREMKEMAEDLGLTIQHVSGICSHLDWAKAAIDAGYSFTSGGVGYCACSMPEAMRPEEYKHCPSPARCHGSMPLDMDDRIHPWRVSTALGDWTRDDPEGELVILASDGGIKNLYEASLDPQASHGDMAYSEEDIEVLVEKVDEALALAEPGQVNQIYFSLSIGAADVDRVFYGRMFQALQPYVEAGRLEYKTLNDTYQEYVRSP